MYLLQTPNRNPAIDMSKYKETSHLITELSCDPDVQKVSVNSTLNKRYIRDDDECLADYDEERERDGGEERERDDGEDREADDGEERERDDSEERERDDGEERETDDDEERETYDDEERETDDDEDRETDDDEDRETDDGEQRETDDGESNFKPIGDRIKVEHNQNKSKVLIICNQFKTKPGMTPQDLKTTKHRRNTLTKAQRVFKEYWHFEVLYLLMILFIVRQDLHTFPNS